MVCMRCAELRRLKYTAATYCYSTAYCYCYGSAKVGTS